LFPGKKTSCKFTWKSRITRKEQRRKKKEKRKRETGASNNRAFAQMQ